MAILTPNYGQEAIWKDYLKRAFEAGFVTEREYNSCIRVGGMRDDLPLKIWTRLFECPVESMPAPGYFIWKMIQMQFEPRLLQESENELALKFYGKFGGQ